MYKGVFKRGKIKGRIKPVSDSNVTNESRLRFMIRVVEHESGCWLLDGKHSNQYGSFSVEGKGMSANRASYLLFKGPIPEDTFVCHTCDVNCCVNPQHLFLGSPSDNSKDMVRKGRQRKPDDDWAVKYLESRGLIHLLKI